MKSTILFFIMLFLFSCSDDYVARVRHHDIDQDFSGIIKDLFFEKGNRGIPVIILNNDSVYHTYTLCCYAEKGDSIIKKAGSLKYFVKSAKRDTSMFFFPDYENKMITDTGLVQGYYMKTDGCVLSK
jgi:hypothetical protein